MWPEMDSRQILFSRSKKHGEYDSGVSTLCRRRHNGVGLHNVSVYSYDCLHNGVKAHAHIHTHTHTQKEKIQTKYLFYNMSEKQTQ